MVPRREEDCGHLKHYLVSIKTPLYLIRAVSAANRRDVYIVNGRVCIVNGHVLVHVYILPLTLPNPALTEKLMEDIDSTRDS